MERLTVRRRPLANAWHTTFTHSNIRASQPPLTLTLLIDADTSVVDLSLGRVRICQCSSDSIGQITVDIGPEWRIILEKLSSIEDRGQTDRVTALPRAGHWPLNDLDVWSWLSIPGELWSWPKHAQKPKFKGQSVQKTQWKQTIWPDGRTDGRTLSIALTSRLTRSVNNWSITKWQELISQPLSHLSYKPY